MKIKRNYKKIIEKLIEINPHIVADIFVDIYTLATLRKDFSEYFDAEINSENILYAITELARIVLSKHPQALEEILEKVIKRNKQYIEFCGYHKYSIEQLIEEFNKNKCPSIHGEGITPGMMLFYLFGENLFNHEYIPELIKYYEIHHQKAKEAKDRYAYQPDIPPPDITKVEQYLYEVEDLQNLENADWYGIAKDFKCEYDEETKTYNKVKRGILLYYDTNIKFLKEAQATYESLIETFYLMSKKLYNSFEKQKIAWKHLSSIAEENSKLKSQVKALRKQLNELESKYKSLNKSTPQNRDKQLTELFKENYYLKTRIEKLEQIIENLEKAQEINKEIQENIVIPEPIKKKKNHYLYLNIRLSQLLAATGFPEKKKNCKLLCKLVK